MRSLIPPSRVGTPTIRHRLLVIAILLAIVALAGRLVWVQGLNASALAAEAVKERTYRSDIPALRGDILDRNGTVMATSVRRYDIWVNQKQVGDYLERDKNAQEKGVGAAAKVLAPSLGLTVEETQAKLTGTKGFAYLVKDVSPEVRDAVLSQKVPGIGANAISKRQYPAGEVGGNVVGFVGGDGKAAAGVERADDELLAGTDGETTYERGAGGQVIPTGIQETTPAVDGKDVALTIDQDLQWKAQQEIAATVQQFGGTGGSVVAINARTGEVLALADYPTYDPNRPGDADPQHLGNQSISNVFEPGSTGKLFTFAALLDQGTVTPASQYVVPSRMEIAGNSIKDSHDHPQQNLTLAGVLKNSSNVGTVEASETVTPQVRYDYLRDFGLGQKTGIELPAESKGILHPVADWTGRTQYTTTFGQGYSVTALQMTSAVSTFANDGVHVQPTVVRGTVGGDGTITPVEPRPQKRVISSATNATMVQLMDNNVPDDGKQNANIPNYAVAGKTGTAQVPGGTYTASFIGFAPADDPDIVIGVFVYGLNSFISGNTAAAPTWARIMDYTLEQQGIAPTGKAGTELPNEW
ncbi:peptidoglycan D,D-transpeptidase FtsI family protein [Brachybacterium sp. AOP25-B2-12]|uniref:peptidoglycan D,D-transpeptidase FtsI family protein n=1 Tax=Brachybacterium sp. AOP25-B2-12 TaxID=3457710 RepID=UPI0040346C51